MQGVFTGFATIAVVIGVAWQWMYDPQGPVNTALTAVGLDAFTRTWLGDFGVALPAVGIIGTPNPAAFLTGRASDLCWRDAKRPVSAAV